MPFAVFERSDSLDHGEEKSCCQPKKKRFRGAVPRALSIVVVLRSRFPFRAPAALDPPIRFVLIVLVIVLVLVIDPLMSEKPPVAAFVHAYFHSVPPFH
jgi:hypothetical protein